mgnify:CR=1 FL=1
MTKSSKLMSTQHPNRQNFLHMKAVVHHKRHEQGVTVGKCTEHYFSNVKIVLRELVFNQMIIIANMDQHYSLEDGEAC